MPRSKKYVPSQEIEDDEDEILNEIEQEAEEEILEEEQTHQSGKSKRSVKQQEVFAKAVAKKKELGQLSKQYENAKKMEKELKLKDKVDYIKSVEDKVKKLRLKESEESNRKKQEDKTVKKNKKKVVKKPPTPPSSSSEEESEEEIEEESSEEEEEKPVAKKKNKQSKSVKQHIDESAEQALLRRLNEERIRITSESMFGNGDLRGLF